MKWSDCLSILFYGTFFAIIWWHRKGFQFFHTDDGPILAADNMLGGVGAPLQSMHKGTAAGFDYNFLVGNGKLMVFVDLKRYTSIHIVALGDLSQESKTLAESVPDKFLKPVELEGDFPNYFHLYCTPDKEVELRQILDPTNMATLVDFCRAYRVELFQDQLFFAQVTEAKDKNDTTTLIQDVTDFLEKNKSLLNRL